VSKNMKGKRVSNDLYVVLLKLESKFNAPMKANRVVFI